MTDIVVMICCAMLGYVVARLINNRLIAREWVYEYLSLFVVDLSDNVKHEKQTLHSFVASSNKPYKDTVLQLLNSGSINKCSLSSSEQAELSQFVRGLDATNSSALLLHLDRFADIFDKQYIALHNSNKSQCSVNTKVGILLGAVLALLLI